MDVDLCGAAPHFASMAMMDGIVQWTSSERSVCIVRHPVEVRGQLRVRAHHDVHLRLLEVILQYSQKCLKNHTQISEDSSKPKIALKTQNACIEMLISIYQILKQTSSTSCYKTILGFFNLQFDFYF